MLNITIHPSVKCAGLVSSHPHAVMALERALRKRVDPTMCKLICRQNNAGEPHQRHEAHRAAQAAWQPWVCGHHHPLGSHCVCVSCFICSLIQVLCCEFLDLEPLCQRWFIKLRSWIIDLISSTFTVAFHGIVRLDVHSLYRVDCAPVLWWPHCTYYWPVKPFHLWDHRRQRSGGVTGTICSLRSSFRSSFSLEKMEKSPRGIASARAEEKPLE